MLSREHIPSKMASKPVWKGMAVNVTCLLHQTWCSECRKGDALPSLRDWVEVFRASIPQFRSRAASCADGDPADRQVPSRTIGANMLHA